MVLVAVGALATMAATSGAAVPTGGEVPSAAPPDLLRPGPAAPPPVPIPEVAPRGRPVPMPHALPRGLPPVPMPHLLHHVKQGGPHLTMPMGPGKRRFDAIP